MRTFEFEDFVEAFGFISQVAILSEKTEHHPEWRNVYNKVFIELTTHVSGNKKTEKDRRLASQIDILFNNKYKS